MKFPEFKSMTISVILQILIWIVFGMAVLFYQPMTWDITVPVQLWIKQSLILAMLAAAYYLNSLVFVPRFLLTSRNSVYILSIVVTFIAVLSISFYADGLLDLHRRMEAAFSTHGPHRNNHNRAFRLDTITLLITALVLGISTSLTAIQKWQTDKEINRLLEQERTSSELSFLKAQINPHFFFNTLNNIYALTLINVEFSRIAIHQLSRMMRYLLYDTQNALTLLSQETDFIKDYISLMQLRLTEATQVIFEVPALLNDIHVAPMLFLPFVENAFKYGVSTTRPCTIKVLIRQHENKLFLEVHNTIVAGQQGSLDEYRGIGIQNTRRRLNLLYPGKHSLHLDRETNPDEFNVYLTLDLA